MRLLAFLRSLAASRFNRSEVDSDVEEELRSHIQHRADDLERSGLVRAEAERRARIEFGGYVRYKEESYEASGGQFLETLLQDLRFALRVLRKSPNFTAVANGDPEQLAAAVRRTLRNLDDGLPVTVKTWNRQLDSALFASRVAMISLGALGVMGAMLAATGIFGMASYSVSKRLREFGIRIALGAQRKEVLRAALGKASRLLVIGSAAGLLLGVMATRVLSVIVYQATPRDPLVLGGVVLAMLMVGLAATWIPAQRALSADPLILLRDQ